MTLPVNFGALAAGKQNLSLLDTQFAAVEPLITTVTNTLAGDVALNNLSAYFTGPSCAQGTAGTWLAVGGITVVDTALGADIFAKLWDGSTVISSAWVSTSNSNKAVHIHLSGVITSPAGNIRISARDITSTSGSILHSDVLGQIMDSTLTVLRLA